MREYALHSNREVCWDAYLGKGECPRNHRYIKGLRDLHDVAEYLRKAHGIEVDAWETNVHVAPRREVSLVIGEGVGHYWELLVGGLAVRSGELDEYGNVITQGQLEGLLAMHKRLVDALFEIDSIG